MYCLDSPHLTLLMARSSSLWSERARNRHAGQATPWLSGEPNLAQMLDDPIIQDVMRSDGVTRHEVEQLLLPVLAPAS